MKRLGIFLAFWAVLPVLLFAETDNEWKEEFDPAVERELLLGFMKNYPMPDLVVENGPDATPEQRAFVKHFKEHIWPELRRLPELPRFWYDPPGGRIEVVDTALDRALYKDEAEKEEWVELKKEVSNLYRQVLSSKKWLDAVNSWAKLSEGLDGQLPEMARMMAEDLRINEFTEEELPLLERINELQAEIGVIAKDSPYLSSISATQKNATDLVEAYHKDELSFEATWRTLEILGKQGGVAFGRDVAERGEALFQEMAVLRSRLAKKKGYKTWAEYVLATYAKHHGDNLKTVDDWNRYLQEILDKTEQPYRDFLEKQASKIPGLTMENLRPSQLSLMSLEGGLRVRSYFPKENVAALWRKTMVESGFEEADVNHIRLDMYPREGKHNHAYMSHAVPSRPKVFRVDSKTLNLVMPEAGGDRWIGPLIQIVQNMRDDGIRDNETMFHEGGHGLHHKKEFDPLGRGNSNAYSETHSMTMEHFFQDIEFLIANGKTRDGKVLTRELAEQYVMEKTINSISSLRHLGAMSQYDIQLWDYDYEAGTEKFVDRALKLYGNAAKKMNLVWAKNIYGIDGRYGMFATGHFYSGDVRYWGYAGAEVAAYEVKEALLDYLEKETGRRTLHKQPKMAKFLIDGLYREGNKLGFPGAIEAVTGRKFSSDRLVQGAVEAVKRFVNPCAKALQKASKVKN